MLATSGNETGWGGGFARFGNFFGFNGSGPGGTYMTTGKPSVAVQMFPANANGFLMSGQEFVNNVCHLMNAIYRKQVGRNLRRNLQMHFGIGAAEQSSFGVLHINFCQ